MRSLLVAILAASAFTDLATAEPDAPSVPTFVVIVNPAHPDSIVERAFLANAFLKKVAEWRHGTPIRPVDLRPTSSVRAAFSQGVLRRSVAAVRNYWQQQIFSGRGLPPPELETDQEVVRYVLKYPGAVGYVSPGATLDGAKVVTVR